MKHWRLFKTSILALTLPLGCLVAVSVWAQSNEASSFEPEERSTLETIPFKSMDSEDMAKTVIEGGLEPTASGRQPRRPQGPGEEILPYADPLLLTPEDQQTDLGRHEIPVEIRYQDPKVIPGQVHNDRYQITPPSNRTYNSYNYNTTPR
ncbi:hypothetical protein QQM79_03610 [Marinobacteraceae bacterium S3BR75-40.1]